MKLSEIVFLAIVSAAAVALCLHGWLVAGHAAMVIGPPAVIAAVLVLLSAVMAWRTLRSEEGSPHAELLGRYWKELSGTFPGLLWCLSALPFILLLGQPIGLAAFAATFARGHGGGWRVSLLCAAFALTVCWLLARGLLGVPLDLLPGWIA